MKGAKADRNVGRRQDCLPQKRGCSTEAEEEGQKPTSGRTAGVARKTACCMRAAGSVSLAAGCTVVRLGLPRTGEGEGRAEAAGVTI